MIKTCFYFVLFSIGNAMRMCFLLYFPSAEKCTGQDSTWMWRKDSELGVTSNASERKFISPRWLDLSKYLDPISSKDKHYILEISETHISDKSILNHREILFCILFSYNIQNFKSELVLGRNYNVFSLFSSVHFLFGILHIHILRRKIILFKSQ